MIARKQSRSGFSLIEQVVAIASVAVVSAVVVPAVVNQLDKSEISRIESDLRALEKATKDFRTDVTYWPGAILQLKDPLASRATAGTPNPDVYGDGILTTVHSDWKGPYFEPKAFVEVTTGQYRLTSAAGTFFSDSLVDATLTPSGSTEPARFTLIRLENVDIEDARKISSGFDGESSLCSGRVQWSTSGAAHTTCATEPTGIKGVLLYYAGPIN